MKFFSVWRQILISQISGRMYCPICVKVFKMEEILEVGCSLALRK